MSILPFHLPDVGSSAEQCTILHSSLALESYIPPITTLWHTTWALIVFIVVIQYIWCVPRLCQKLHKDLNLSRYLSKGEPEWSAKWLLAAPFQTDLLIHSGGPSPKSLHQQKHKNNLLTSRRSSTHTVLQSYGNVMAVQNIKDPLQLFVVENVLFSFYDSWPLQQNWTVLPSKGAPLEEFRYIYINQTVMERLSIMDFYWIYLQ